MSAPFIHLRVATSYSLAEGAIRIKDLVKHAGKYQMPAVGMADFGNLFAALEFSLAASEAGIQPIIGCVLPIHVTGTKFDKLPLIAQTDAGYKNLLALVSDAWLQPEGGHPPRLSLEKLQERTEGIIALTGGVKGGIARHLLNGKDEESEALLLQLKALFPNRLYIEIERHGLKEERETEPKFIKLAQTHEVPLVATNDAHFASRDMAEAHEALLCIADGTYIHDPNRRKLTAEHYFKSPKEMEALFADLPEAIASTWQIAMRCSTMAPKCAPILPRFAGTEEEEAELLRQQAREGLAKRLEDTSADHHPAYFKRLEFELDTIARMKFPGYFLIVSDFIRWSKQNGIPVGPGRGSGAGSVAAWALDITDLDPLRFGLLFERFLNPERVSMPDFDVDFCQDRRGEVIDYVQKKYGKDKVAQIITFGKLQARAVLRDVGRVLQMPYGQVDKICKLVPVNPADPIDLNRALEMEPLLRQAANEDESTKKLIEIGLKLEGLNRHASTHAAGVVIADRPLSELVPLYKEEGSEMPVVGFSMKYSEIAGLVKFDFLGLKTLTVLVTALELLKPRGITLDLLKLPEGDPKTYAMLAKGETSGVFQLESSGMRDTLRKLKADKIEDIIALVSLYRPGPMDNIPTYIACKHGQEAPDYLHPMLEDILKETHGVIIYQEQVMQIAQVMAGYSLGEADLLRRAMGKKIKEEMEAQRARFVQGAKEKGVKASEAGAIFDLIAKFAGYGFNKSHAAAYALIAYQTAYVKANYPVEFYAATMRYDMHQTEKLAAFKREAEHAGITVLPPDINASRVHFSVEVMEDGVSAIRYGLAAIRNVGEQAMAQLVAERAANGPFKDAKDLATRLGNKVINRRQLEYLTKAGAFDSFGISRRQVFEQLDYLIGLSAEAGRAKESNQASLFGEQPIQQPANTRARAAVEEWETAEKLQHELSAIGFYLTSHPLSGMEEILSSMGVVFSRDLTHQLKDKARLVRLAGIVTSRKVRVSPRGRFAFVGLSDPQGSLELTIYDENLLNKHMEWLEAGKALLATVEGRLEGEGARLIVQKLELLEGKAVQVKQDVRIPLAHGFNAQELKNLLGEPQREGVKVLLDVTLENGSKAEIALPGLYAISPQAMQRLNNFSQQKTAA